MHTPLTDQALSVQKPHRNRRKNLRKFSLVLLQSAVLFLGSLLATSQAHASTEWCSDTDPGGYPYPVSGIQYNNMNYNMALYFSPNPVNPYYGCVTYYSGSNWYVTWSIPSHLDFIPGLAAPNWDINISAAKSTAQAYHHHALTVSNGSRVYFGLYGRMNNTDTEWYIIDDWAGTQPQPWMNNGLGPILKRIQIAGAYYDVYQVLEGPKNNIQQWWSVREQTTTSGYIPYIQHFQAWESISGPGGTFSPNENLKETRIVIEANEAGYGTLTVYSMDESTYPPK